MKSSKSALFLMELIISILFFALASTVCIQLFAKSHTLGQTTKEDSHALVICQNYAELFNACIDATEDEDCDWSTVAKEICSYTSANISSDGSIVEFFDKNWESTSEENAQYVLNLKYLGFNREDSLYEATVKVTRADKTDEVLFEIPVAKHLLYKAK